MKFVSLSSSSQGNSELIVYKDTKILVDCGISAKRIVDSLDRFGIKPNEIDYILITHEHSDHIQGLPVLYSKYKINAEIITQYETACAIKNEFSRLNKDYENIVFNYIKPTSNINENYIKIKDIDMIAYESYHDVPCLFYKLKLGDTILAILTDCGTFNRNMIYALSNVNYLMLECNYDISLLQKSEHYSDYIKKRISSDYGHMSNEDTVRLIVNIDNENLKKIYLSHISEHSNNELYAKEFCVRSLTRYSEAKSLPYNIADKISVARRIEETIILDEDD